MAISNLSNGEDREKSPPPDLPPHGAWGPPDLLAARVAALLKHDLAHCLRDEVAGLFQDLVAEHSELKEVNNSIEDVSRYLGISSRKLRSEVAAGRLVPETYGTRHVFPRQNVLAYREKYGRPRRRRVAR